VNFVIIYRKRCTGNRKNGVWDVLLRS